MFSFQISEIFVTFPGWWFSRLSQHEKTIFKVDIKLQILWQLISLWCQYYNIWTRFYLLLCTWTFRSSRPEELYKKGVVKYSTKFTGKHLRWILFPNKAAGWRSVTSVNTESRIDAFLSIFWNMYKDIYFANIYEVMPLIRKISLLEFLSVIC